jgi:hypothetical protein
MCVWSALYAASRAGGGRGRGSWRGSWVWGRSPACLWLRVKCSKARLVVKGAIKDIAAAFGLERVERGCSRGRVGASVRCKSRRQESVCCGEIKQKKGPTSKTVNQPRRRQTHAPRPRRGTATGREGILDWRGGGGGRGRCDRVRAAVAARHRRAWRGKHRLRARAHGVVPPERQPR